jgi:hypothetical protein
MLFNAAKDLVYTVDGNKITSGGYRINKILGSNTTKKGQKGGKKHYSEKTDFFNEDSGIPVGLLLLQSQHKYLIRSPSKNGNNQKNFVYIVNEDESEHENQGENEELVIVPQSFISSSPLENPMNISSNEIDDDLYDVLLKNASYSESGSAQFVKNKSSTKKRHFGAHMEKVFQKRKTKSKRRV